MDQVANKFKPSMRKAAFRHQEAAEKLYNGARQDVAGYLYGIAAECGIKALMINCGMKPANPRKADDPFYAHFSLLKTMLRDSNQARQQNDLRKFTDDVCFMEDWDIAMRYSDGKTIQKKWVNRWRQNATDVLAEL